MRALRRGRTAYFWKKNVCGRGDGDDPGADHGDCSGRQISAAVETRVAEWNCFRLQKITRAQLDGHRSIRLSSDVAWSVRWKVERLLTLPAAVTLRLTPSNWKLAPAADRKRSPSRDFRDSCLSWDGSSGVLFLVARLIYDIMSSRDQWTVISMHRFTTVLISVNITRYR